MLFRKNYRYIRNKNSVLFKVKKKIKYLQTKKKIKLFHFRIKDILILPQRHKSEAKRKKKKMN